MRQVRMLRSGVVRSARPGAALLALLLTASAPALARRVAVAAFEGPQADAAEKAVVEVLIKEGHLVIRAAEWKAAVAEAGQKASPEETLAAAARKLKVSAIVLGTIQPPQRGKAGRASTLVIVVHDGKTGSRLEGVEVQLKRGRMDAAATTTIALNLPPVIPLGQEPVEEKPVAAQAPSDAESPESLAARRVARQAASQPVVAPVQRRRTIAVAGAGLNLWGRRMRPKPGGSADAYDGGPMPPGIHLEVEAYPAARFVEGIAGDFGIGGYFSQAWLTSKFPGATDTINVGTTYMRGGVDLRFRREFKPDHPFGPTVRAAIAFTYVGFKLSASGRASIAGINLPDASLYGVGPVVGVVVPLGRPWLRAGASFGGFYVTGPDSNAPNGTSYGSGWAIDTTLHVDWLPIRWLQVRAELGVAHYGSAIDPTAPATTTGLADTYFTGLLTASYVY
ncbi:MAG: hypothetical protein HY906_21535 [Deltaproteobacteria bacterium]|nr:hypothetical protein [Deltaproteobacteria bacterium]